MVVNPNPGEKEKLHSRDAKLSALKNLVDMFDSRREKGDVQCGRNRPSENPG